MNVQPINTQPNDPGFTGAAQGNEQGGQSPVSSALPGSPGSPALPASPPTFDTSQSQSGDEPSHESADVSAAPDPALNRPAQGAPGSWIEQTSPKMVTRWQRDDHGVSILKQVDPAPNADGSPGNVATEFKLDRNGNPVLAGARSIPRAAHDGSQDRTQADVFWSGFRQGVTHPGRFFGEVKDAATGDKSHSGERSGEQVDRILEKVPVVGTAINLARGIAGEKNPDGSPILPAPDVQPDVPENSLGTRSPARPPVDHPLISPSPTEGKLAAAERVTRPSSEPEHSTSQAKTPSADGPGATTSSRNSATFDVPARYARKPGGDLHADPANPGVFRDARGQTYIEASGEAYPVRYDKDNGTWRVYNPDDPAKFQYPVRPDGQGQWQVHDDVGLKGGGWGNHVPQDLQARHAQLLNQRQQLRHEQQHLQDQLVQFPGPGNAHRSGMELAYLQHALQGRLSDVNNRLQALEHEVQQVQEDMRHQQQAPH